MSGNVQITTRGHAAIASPEQLGNLDSFITCAVHEFEQCFGDDDNLGTVDVRHLLTTAKLLVTELKGQLDADHQYVLCGPCWEPVFAYETADDLEARAQTAQAEADFAAAQVAKCEQVIAIAMASGLDPNTLRYAPVEGERA